MYIEKTPASISSPTLNSYANGITTTAVETVRAPGWLGGERKNKNEKQKQKHNGRTEQTHLNIELATGRPGHSKCLTNKAVDLFSL